MFRVRASDVSSRLCSSALLPREDPAGDQRRGPGLAVVQRHARSPPWWCGDMLSLLGSAQRPPRRLLTPRPQGTSCRRSPRCGARRSSRGRRGWSPRALTCTCGLPRRFSMGDGGAWGDGRAWASGSNGVRFPCTGDARTRGCFDQPVWNGVCAWGSARCAHGGEASHG